MRHGPALLLILAPGLLLGQGCATGHATRGPAFHYFAEPDPASDPWFAKVEAWQTKAREQRVDRVSASLEPGERASARSSFLRKKMGAFQASERRSLARSIAEFSQEQARLHYRKEADEDPANDHWPTFKELADRNGDDCDGLDLIAYQLMQEFGFPPEELYRAIVMRERDGANHMVTLWFEEREDPWVVDATGAMTLRMRRFSELPGWRPTKVFNETRQFSVVERSPHSFAVVRD